MVFVVIFWPGFQTFLKCRAQRVVVGGVHSAWTDVISGIPQGTVLSPLLFLAYVNDLPNNLNSEVRLFLQMTALFTVKFKMILIIPFFKTI